MTKRKADQQEVEGRELDESEAFDFGPVRAQLIEVQNDLAGRIVLDVMGVVVQGVSLTEEHYRNLDLVDSPNINMICYDLDALIHAAVRVDDQVLLSYLITRGDVEVMSQNVNGDTALMIAVICEDQTSILVIMDWMKRVKMPVDLNITNLQGISLSDLINSSPDAEIINDWVEGHNASLAEVPTREESLGADAPIALGEVFAAHSDSEVDNVSSRFKYLGAAAFEGREVNTDLLPGYNTD